ncbi:hypothetical protein MLD38_018378 [Melastoma candidum]|uniref:Uncharacterized protein n=1 Tax=Melastoma candidum TaxID=119954 RepID=A0ACB9QTL4_9MYRT|nr:hypothetical protein MLD38_018378 [Melastoma candidum]
MRRTRESSRVAQPFSLPTYHPSSNAAEQEMSRARSAENAIHLIPLLVLLCLAILCVFVRSSNSDSPIRDGLIQVLNISTNQ